jgi:hypothetical protein
VKNSCNCKFTIIQTTTILKVVFRGVETLKRARASTPKMAGKSAVKIIKQDGGNKNVLVSSISKIKIVWEYLKKDL